MLLATVCGGTSARADETAGDTIVVTGEGLRTPPAAPAYGVVDITREQIVRTASGRLEDVLSQAAGLQQFRRSDSRSANPSAQGITLRGLGGNASSRTLVLLDGVPLADPMFGSVPLSALAPELLSSLRVTRGGGAGAFGTGAVAGTVELTSADAHSLGLTSGSAMANNRGETALAAAVAPQLGQGFAVLAARWDRGEGFWTTPANQRSAASVPAAYAAWSASLRMVAPLTDAVEVQARGALFEDRRTLRFAGADSFSGGQDASLRLVGRGDWQFEALAYVQARNFRNVVISSSTFRKTLDQSNTPSTGWGGKLELRPPLGDAHVLRLGIDWRGADGQLEEAAYNGGTGLLTARRRAGGRSSDLGLYLEHDWTLGPLVLTAGARADRWHQSGGFFQERSAAGTLTTDTAFAPRSGWDSSFRGGAVWHAAPGLALRGSAYAGLRLPTLNELYRPFVVFPVTTRANAALVNEEVFGFEGGVDVTPNERLSLSLTLFDNRVRQAVANVTVGPNLRQRQNVDAVHSRGVEFDGTARLGTVTVNASMAWTDARVEGSGAALTLNGMRPAQTPRLIANAGASWQPRAGWLVSATLRHTGAQFEDDLETDLLPAATTLSAYAELPLTSDIRLVLRGENLTDTAVITRNQGGSIDLGPPRTLWVGLKLGLGNGH